MRSLWAVAAIGLAIGAGLYLAGVVATAVALVILSGLKPLERRLSRKKSMTELSITVDRKAFDLRELESILDEVAIDYTAITLLPETSPTEDLLRLKLRSGLGAKKTTQLLEKLRSCPGVKEARTGEVAGS